MACGRVTNPERFTALLPLAADVLDRLEAQHRVVRTERLDVDPGLVAHTNPDAARVVRLAPEGGGAPLVVAFTGFPSLRIRFGRWHIEGYPVCGCDACDEQVNDLADDLAQKVDALVKGRFTERLSLLRRPGLSYSFGNGSGWSWSPRREVMSLGRPQRISWPAWPGRDGPAAMPTSRGRRRDATHVAQSAGG